MVTVVSCLRLGKLAFARDPLMRFVGALDAILAAVEEQLTEIGSLGKWPSLRHANENKCVHWHDDRC